MFVCSLKGSTLKLIGAVAVSAFTLALLIGIIPNEPDDSMLTIAGQYEKISSSDSAKAYIESLGYTIEDTECEEIKTEIPKSFDAVMEKYNEIQLSQGFDLNRYKGKTVDRYSFDVSNGPDGEELVEDARISILVYKGKPIGGDICSRANGPTVAPFIKS